MDVGISKFSHCGDSGDEYMRGHKVSVVTGNLHTKTQLDSFRRLATLHQRHRHTTYGISSAMVTTAAKKSVGIWRNLASVGLQWQLYDSL